MADSGGGHRTAAVSLSEALEGQARVNFLNLMDEYAPFPFNRFSEAYGPWVNLAPWSYRMVYRAFASRRSVEDVQRAAYPLVRRQVAAAFAAARPNLVISVHPVQISIPLRVLREMGNTAPFVTVVTDPVTPPVAWFCPDVDLCVVATEAARQTALACGMAPERVKVIGLPVRRAFTARRGQDKAEARGRLHMVDPTKRLILLSGGGAGIGKLLPLAKAMSQRLSESRTPVQMAIIAGRNKMLQRRLRAERWPVPVTVLGYVEEMANWLAAADLLITKAGPGTLAEAACLGVPVLITGFIPGQEEGNVTWAEQHGSGAFERDPRQAAALVYHWLRPGNPALDEMAANARNLAQCDAARQIAQHSLALIQRAIAEPDI